MPNIDDFLTPAGQDAISGGGAGGGFGISALFSSPQNFASLTGGVSSIFSGAGDEAEAGDYQKAAQIAAENAQIAAESTKIQQGQEARQAFMVFGQQGAAEGGGNLAAAGSNLDVLRSSMTQAALQHQIIGLQGAVTENSFKQQQLAYEGQAEAAKAAGAGGIFSGILGVVSAFIPH